MSRTGFDQDALITMFAQASAKQGEALRQAVSQALLQALQGRELTLKNMRQSIKAVTEAASTGAAQNPAPLPDVEKMLEKAFAGMDAALLQAVEANRKALQQLVGQGAELAGKPMQAALGQVEQMEDMFFAAVTKAASSADGAVQGPWSHVLEQMKVKGTQTGAQAASVTAMLEQAQGAMRAGRASGLKATQTLLDSYAALVSGVLIGMSEALQSGAGASGEAKAAAKKTAR
jgi:hypothetical protein